MIELYHLPQSICSQKVRLALAEKGLNWTGHVVDLARFDHLQPDYLALNPNGVVPTLVHDGAAIIESTVICEYLDEVFPTPPLSPRDAPGRARMRAWLRFIDEVPSMAVRVPSFNLVLLPAYQAMARAEFEGHLARMTIRRAFFRRMGQRGFSSDEVADAMDQLAMTEERIARALDQTGGPFLLGQEPSCADLCLAPVVNRMQELGLLTPGNSAGSSVRLWLDRLRARPSWALAYPPGSEMTLADETNRTEKAGHAG
ncbi:MAG: glutathione S-transferase family protein [Pararhodobacter sp.]|nr:glutathione S-transferase family protein [Pararhodobacter sp.]